MTYFSRVPLNKARIGAQKLLTDGYKMHAAVEACFPPGIPTVTEQGRLLYRVIDDRVNHSIYLYVVSPEKPDFTSLVEQAGWKTQPGETLDYDTALEGIKEGDELRFSLRANAVRRNADGKRVGCNSPEEYTEYLNNAAAKSGFELVEYSVTGDTTERLHKPGQRKPVTLKSLTVVGILRVTDAQAFLKACMCGVGRGKGFGFGLLLLSR